MATYKFPDDRLEIVDPTIFSIDENSITLNNIEKTVNAYVVLIDPSGTKVSPLKAFDSIPRDSDTWDACDLLAIVTKKLLEFKIQ